MRNLNFRHFLSFVPDDLAQHDQIQRLAWWQRVPLIPLRLVCWVWTRTLRFEMTPEARAALGDTDAPTVVVLWHNRLFVISEIFRRWRSDRPVYALISASKDGAWLAGISELFGLRTVRGSSSRRGAEAMRELLDRLSDGSDVAITPDGPRGPAYSFKPGATGLVRRSGARVLLFGSRSPSAWRVRSWDRFILPRPFSTVSLDARILRFDELPADGRACAEALRTAMLEINEV